MVDLEVSSVHEGSCWCFNSQRTGINDGVGVVYPLDLHISNVILLSFGNKVEVFGVAFETMFIEFVFDHRQCKRCSVNREFQLFKEVRYCTNVVFVTVCDNNGFDLVFNGMQVGEVWYKNVYTMHRLIRERHTDIDDNGSGFCLKYSHVPTNFTQSAKWCKSDFTLACHIDLLPWVHSCFLNTFVLFNGSFHCIIHRGDILFASSAFIVVLAVIGFVVLFLPRLVIWVWLSVLVVSVVIIGFFVTVDLFFLNISVYISVGVRFTVRVWFSVGIVIASVFSTLSVLVVVLSVRVWSSFPVLCITVGCFLPLILRVFAVCFVAFHLNYPLIHYICDDK